MTNEIVRSIDIKAAIDWVWRAISDPAEFGAWFGCIFESAFVPGQIASGRITIPDFDHVPMTIRVTAMEPPHLFAFTWHPYAIERDRDYSREQPTLVELRLTEIAGGTRVTVTESGFNALPETRRDDALRANTGGWEAQLRNIAAYVAG